MSYHNRTYLLLFSRFIYNTGNPETRRKSLVEFAKKTNVELSENDLNAFELSFEAEKQNAEHAKKVTYRQHLKFIKKSYCDHISFRRLPKDFK